MPNLPRLRSVMPSIGRDPREQLIASLTANQPRQITRPTQGLAVGVQNFLAGRLRNEMRRDEEEVTTALAEILSGGSSGGQIGMAAGDSVSAPESMAGEIDAAVRGPVAAPTPAPTGAQGLIDALTSRLPDNQLAQRLVSQLAMSQMLGPQAAPESFTLKPGEARFRGGKKVASLSALPPKTKLLTPEVEAQKIRISSAQAKAAAAPVNALTRSVNLAINQERAAKLREEVSLLQGKNADAKRERMKQQRAAQSRVRSVQTQSKVVVGKIDQALNLISDSPQLTTGWLGGQLLSNVGGTKAKALRSRIDTIKSNLGIKAMADLRSASPTGSTGLGAMSENELTLIQSQVANLDQAQSPQELVAMLDEVKVHFEVWRDIVESAPIEAFAPVAAPASAAPAAAPTGGGGVIDFSELNQ